MEVKKPERFTYHLGESPVVKKLTKKRDRRLYDFEVTEVDNANKRLKIHYVSYSTTTAHNWMSGDPLVAMKNPNIPLFFAAKKGLSLLMNL